LVLVCEEPPVQSCLHQWVLHSPLPLCRSVHILLGKDFNRAFERQRNRSLTEEKRYASPKATWSSLLAWAMDVFSCAHKELSEVRWSCLYWWTSLKPLCYGSGCGCSCGCGLLLSQCERHGSQMLWS
jgi:hypothetical protein